MPEKGEPIQVQAIFLGSWVRSQSTNRLQALQSESDPRRCRRWRYLQPRQPQRLQCRPHMKLRALTIRKELVRIPIVAFKFEESISKDRDIDRVPLPPLLTHPSTNPAVLKVQEELQKSIEELEAELAKYANKFSGYAPLQDDNVKSAMSSSDEDGTGFGRVIEQVLSDQKIKNGTVPGKVGTFIGQLYPIAGIVLGIVSFSADVRASCPVELNIADP